MFFNNTVDNTQIEKLTARIAELEDELSLYKDCFEYSQEEICVVVDNNRNITLQNTLAKSMIKDPSALVKELPKGSNEINLNECSGKVKSKSIAKTWRFTKGQINID